MSSINSNTRHRADEIDPERKRRLSYLFRSIVSAPADTLQKIECIIAEDMIRGEQEGSPWISTPIPSWQQLFGCGTDSVPLSSAWPRDIPHFVRSVRKDEVNVILHKGTKYFCNRTCARCLSLPCRVPILHQHSDCKCATCSWLDAFSSILEVSMTVLASEAGESVCRFPCAICGVSTCKRIDNVCICMKCLYMVESGRRRCAHIWHTSPIIAGPPCSSTRWMHWCRGYCALCLIYECSICTSHEPSDCRCLKCRRMVARPSRTQCILDEID